MTTGIETNGTSQGSLGTNQAIGVNRKTGKTSLFPNRSQLLHPLEVINDEQAINSISNRLSQLTVNGIVTSEGEITTPTMAQSKNNTEQLKTVQILVWHKGSGKDVGHTAVRIDNKVYGYYPSDTNGNDVYDKDELWSSKGNLHIDQLADFNKKYSGDKLEVFSLDSSKEKRSDLEQYFNDLEKTPGDYNLLMNQCTTTAMKGLRKADYFDVLYATAPEALSKKLTFLNKLGLSGVDKVTTIKAENLK